MNTWTVFAATSLSSAQKDARGAESLLDPILRSCNQGAR